MNRVINLSPWDKISMSTEVQHHTLIDIATIIISDDEDYYIIEDDIEKVMDVSQMPHYIKEDWINYNKKELTQSVIDKHIKVYTDKYESRYPPSEATEKTLSTLKSIKRHLIIKNII
jgi:hypothetical protein